MNTTAICLLIVLLLALLYVGILYLLADTDLQIRSLEKKHLEAQNALAVEVLGFYAATDNYDHKGPGLTVVGADKGLMARNFLDTFHRDTDINDRWPVD